MKALIIIVQRLGFFDLLFISETTSLLTGNAERVTRVKHIDSPPYAVPVVEAQTPDSKILTDDKLYDSIFVQYLYEPTHHHAESR